MKVRELMTTPAYTCRANATLDQAAAIMDEHDVGTVVITDVENHAVGMLTDRDVCLAAHRHDKRLREVSMRDVMSPSAIACRPDDDAALALRAMKDNAVRRLAVIDDEGRPAGLLSIDDLAEAISKAGGEELDGVSSRELVAVIGAVGRGGEGELPAPT